VEWFKYAVLYSAQCTYIVYTPRKDSWSISVSARCENESVMFNVPPIVASIGTCECDIICEDYSDIVRWFGREEYPRRSSDYCVVAVACDTL
jgi:hypothetical protein